MKVHILLNSILTNSIDIGAIYILSEWLVYHSIEGHKIEHLYYEQMLEMR